MVRFPCPSCGFPLSAPEDCAGRGSYCRSCKKPVIVPAPVPVPFVVPVPVALPVPKRPPAPTQFWVLPVGGVVVLGVCVMLAVMLLFIDLFGRSTPNARCPQCLTPCHIHGLEKMNFFQRAAKQHRCPFCGEMDAVHVFAVMGGSDATPPGQGIEDVIVPDM